MTFKNLCSIPYCGLQVTQIVNSIKGIGLEAFVQAAAMKLGVALVFSVHLGVGFD